MQSAAALLLFCFLAVSILLVLLQGADLYRRLNQRSQLVYEQRTCSGYLTEKIRQAPGNPYIQPFGEGDAIQFEETIGGEVWTTWIYCYDGWIWEYYGSDAVPESPELGEKIFPAEGLSLSTEGRLLQILVEDRTGGQTGWVVYLRNGAYV